MIRGQGRNRKYRRTLLIGGWVASMMVAVLTAVVVCPTGTENCGIVILAIAVGAALWHRVMKREGGVAVLMYHSVTSKGDWLPWSRDISVSPELFSRQLDVLARTGCTVLRTSELAAARMAGEPLGRRPVVIHFDDGYLDNWVAALPLLKRYGFPATVFVSTNFVDPGEEVRPNLTDVEDGRVKAEDLQWEGYLNWPELRAMERSGLIDVECHGTDHGCVPVSGKIVGKVTRENWRAHAWMQWRCMEGDKSHWYRHAEPPFKPVGTPIPENAPAFVARAWRHGAWESKAAHEQRVHRMLSAAKQAIETRLAKQVRIFCWPFNASTADTHGAALEAGYSATTGGDGENRPGEDPTRISRVHVGAGILWWPNLAVDKLYFRATVRLMQGNYYWGLLVIPVNIVRRVVQTAARLVKKA